MLPDLNLVVGGVLRSMTHCGGGGVLDSIILMVFRHVFDSKHTSVTGQCRIKRFW